MSKANQIRSLLAEGKNPKEIAIALGVKPMMVHQVKWYDKNKTAKQQSKRGRPRKTVNTDRQLEHFAALQNQIFELRAMIANLQQKRPLMDRIRAVFQ